MKTANDIQPEKMQQLIVPEEEDRLLEMFIGETYNSLMKVG